MPSRKDYQFMKLCLAGAKIFSTCSKRQYMAILVNENNHLVGMGYNGGPSNFVHCTDGGCPRMIEQSPHGSNYDNCISTHAEQNAFLHSSYTTESLKLYVNGPPCFTCAKLIGNSNVTQVFYLEDKGYVDWSDTEAFLNKAGVETVCLPTK